MEIIENRAKKRAMRLGYQPILIKFIDKHGDVYDVSHRQWLDVSGEQPATVIWNHCLGPRNTGRYREKYPPARSAGRLRCVVGFPHGFLTSNRRVASLKPLKEYLQFTHFNKDLHR